MYDKIVQLFYVIIIMIISWLQEDWNLYENNVDKYKYLIECIYIKYDSKYVMIVKLNYFLFQNFSWAKIKY
jgi:hypothetical protein